jgi:hypothetical protein
MLKKYCEQSFFYTSGSQLMKSCKKTIWGRRKMDCSLPLYQEKKCCNSFDTFRASDKRQDQYLAA